MSGEPRRHWLRGRTAVVQGAAAPLADIAYVVPF